MAVGTFQNTDENQKAMFVFLCLLSCPVTGKPLFTSQELADAFGKEVLQSRIFLFDLIIVVIGAIFLLFFLVQGGRCVISWCAMVISRRTKHDRGG